MVPGTTACASSLRQRHWLRRSAGPDSKPAAPFEVDGNDLAPALDGATPPDRSLYAESVAPLLDFGWSPLRSVRVEGYKYIAAPKPELYDVRDDEAEERNLVEREKQRAEELNAMVQRASSESLRPKTMADQETRARLQALGYTSRGGGPDERARPDPKDKRELAARIAQVTSGELEGQALEQALQQILRDDPQNPQAHLRLGYVLLDDNRCAAAEAHFRKAIESRLPSADAHLGLASCQATARRFREAAATLQQAEVVEPDNPVVVANLGIVLSDGCQPDKAIPRLQRALTLDADFHEARFNLALAFARAGHREKAAAEARELLRRLPQDAPQRSEVERLIAAVQ
jgi:choline-sulfatase